ncbi:THAP domain-containing protein 5-like isoform X2 [Ceratina calcarata]|uniref:THAP domain-containing protein 5-like isoform X2 n=1 Tax=Ceratina calcarata TaxID=156304 RepID=A0AAJ7J5R5_9HYME|nr:THAP domain-containing protein 5-like isoform X2 [Ceratina calcarata]
MVSYCCICRRKYDKNNGISFHAFPKSRERRAAWEIACKLEKPAPASIQICSEHFTPDSFMRFYGIRLLKLSAIPSKFPWNKENNLAASNFEDHTYAQCDRTSVSSKQHQEYGIKVVSSSCIPSKETCNVPKILSIENPSFQMYSPYTQSNTTVLNQPPECELEVATSSCEISVQTEEDCEVPSTKDSTILYFPDAESNTTFVLNQEQECEREVTVPSNECNLPKAPNTQDASIQIHPPSSATSKWQSEDTNGPVKKRKIWRPARIGDLAPEHFSTPRKAALNIEMIRKKNHEKSLKIKVLQTQNNRLLKRLKVLEELIADLEDNDLIPETLKLKKTKTRGLTKFPRTKSSLVKHEKKKT